MSAIKLEELKADLAELNKLSKLAERPKIKDIFLIETRKLETEIATIQDSCKMEIDSSADACLPKKIVTPGVNRCYEVKLTNYAWDQSDKFVKIFVTVNNVHNIPEENVQCKFDSGSVEMIVKELDNRNYTFTIKNLLENINVENSKWKVKKDMVVIFLSKAQNTKWGYLTLIEKKAKEPKSSLPKMDPNEDPTTGLMDLMKKMYEEGDDDMKRTIAQSWTESSAKNKMGW